MQQKLTNEERARVFAVYYGCQYTPDSKTIVKNSTGYSIEFHSKDDDCKLLLTSLKNISDEDAVEVAKIVYNKSKYRNAYSVLAIDGKQFIKQWESDMRVSVSSTPMLSISIFQYLIQKGYAVPLFFGINHWANGKTAIELGIAIEKQ